MKRFLTFVLIVSFIMLTALSASARTIIGNNELDTITAQEGVSIDFSRVSVGNVTSLSSISWGDTSGFSGYTTPGYFGFKNLTITGNLMTIGYGSDATANRMTLDVGTGGGETKVIIVLPTITLGTANISGWVMADQNSTFTSAAQSQGGIITLNGFSTQVTGTLAIYAHD
jgi:hypothetical protein